MLAWCTTLTQFPVNPKIFCNKTISMKIKEKSLRASSDRYEKLPDPLGRSEESGYTQLRKEPHEYLEILTEHVGYVGIVEYTDSPQTHPESFMDKVVSAVTEDEFGYTRLQKELDGYEKLRHGLMQTEDHSGSTYPQSLSHGYVDISEYNDSNVTTPAGSMETEGKSGNTLTDSQYEGYVGIVDYPNSLKFTYQSSQEAEEDIHQSQYAGHVDVVDYAETSASYSETLKNKDNFLGMAKGSESAHSQNQASGYVDITEYPDTLQSSFK